MLLSPAFKIRSTGKSKDPTTAPLAASKVPKRYKI